MYNKGKLFVFLLTVFLHKRKREKMRQVFHSSRTHIKSNTHEVSFNKEEFEHVGYISCQIHVKVHVCNNFL